MGRVALHLQWGLKEILFGLASTGPIGPSNDLLRPLVTESTSSALPTIPLATCI
jgi:hypothetical protein